MLAMPGGAIYWAAIAGFRCPHTTPWRRTAGRCGRAMTIDVGGRDVADRWFLARGMPAVLTSRARWRHLLPRSAPALAACAAVVTALLVAYVIIGTSEIYIDGAPTPVERLGTQPVPRQSDGQDISIPTTQPWRALSA